MTRKQKVIAGLVILIAGIGSYFGYCRLYNFPEPAKWKEAHIGLDRSEIHRLAGPPDTDSYDIKRLDRWHKRTLEGYWTLDVFYYDSKETNRCSDVFVNLFTTFRHSRSIRLELSPEQTNGMQGIARQARKHEP